MPRAPEGKVERGGQVAPGVQQSVVASGQRASNRILQAMREGGASQRAGIGAQAQVQTAQIGAQSRQAVAGIQAGVQDRATAARIKGAQEDREHLESMTRMTDSMATKREERRQAFDKAIHEGNVDLAKDIHRNQEASRVVDRMTAQKRSDDLNTSIRKLAAEQMDMDAKAAKVSVNEWDRSKEIMQYQKTIGTVRKNFKDGLEAEQYDTFLDEVTVPSKLDTDFANLRVSAGFNSKYLNPEHQSKLEDFFAGGGLKPSDITNIQIVLEERKAWQIGRTDDLISDKTQQWTKPIMGRMLYPFEEFFTEEEEWVGKKFGEIPRKKIGVGPTEAGDLRTAREENLAKLNSQMGTWEAMKSSTRKIEKGEGAGQEVGKYVQGVLERMTESSDYDRTVDIETNVRNAEQMKRYLESETTKMGGIGTIDPDSIDLSGMKDQKMADLVLEMLQEQTMLYNAGKMLNVGGEE